MGKNSKEEYSNHHWPQHSEEKDPHKWHNAGRESCRRDGGHCNCSIILLLVLVSRLGWACWFQHFDDHLLASLAVPRNPTNEIEQTRPVQCEHSHTIVGEEDGMSRMAFFVLVLGHHQHRVFGVVEMESVIDLEPVIWCPLVIHLLVILWFGDLPPILSSNFKFDTSYKQHLEGRKKKKKKTTLEGSMK